MTSYVYIAPQPTGDTDIEFYHGNADALLYSISTPNPVMRVTADSVVTIAGNLTVSVTLSTANIAAANITTTEAMHATASWGSLSRSML